ncbi:insulinase family protein [bacterium]|nr:insulinase family protein [bacterium]
MKVRSTDNYKNIFRYEFDNGLVLLTKPVKDLPIISFRGCIRGGSLFESDVQSGLTKMLCLLLKAGTPSRTAVTIADELDFMGTSLQFSPHYDAVNFSLSCLSKHFEKSLNCTVDLLFNSTFPENEIERLRRTALAALKRKADQPSQVASDQFQESVYGNHPYRRSLDGYEQSLRSLKQEDMVTFHKSNMTADKLILTAVGDFDSDDLEKSVTNHFDIPAAIATADELPHVQNLNLKKTHIIRRDIMQANICMGNIAVRRKSDDHYASLLMNYILGGGGLTSRLTHRIRTQKGLAYSVHSSMTKRLLGGTFSVTVQTKTENAGHAVQTIREEMLKMQDEPVTDLEIQDAKSFFKGHFPFRIEAIENEAAYLEMAEFYGLGLDYLDREAEAMDIVTKQEIQSAAKKYLNPERFVLSVAGNKDKLESQFKE